VVVHCAANTGFHVPLDEILATNAVGFIELLKVAAGCKRLKVRAVKGVMALLGTYHAAPQPEPRVCSDGTIRVDTLHLLSSPVTSGLRDFTAQ